MSEEDVPSAPARGSSNPRQFITKRQSSNKHFDPFGEFAFLTHAAVALFSPFALSIMVFLRSKLGYRMPKPFLLATVFQWLVVLCLIVNFGSFAWFLAKQGTPLGEYLRQYDTQKRLAQIPSVPKPPETDSFGKPFLPGVDAALPDAWASYSQKQRADWVNLHRLTPAGQRELDAKREEQERQQQAAEKERSDAIAAINAEAEADKRRPFYPHIALLIFAGAFLWRGIKARRAGARLIKQGWHTMSRGVSYLSKFFPTVNEYRLQAFYEPGCVFLLGAAIAVASLLWDFFSLSLGIWLMVAAVCLSLTEIMLMELALNEALDKYDSEIEGRQYSDIRKAIRSSVEEQRVQSTGGIRGAVFDPETAAILQQNAMRTQELEKSMAAD